MTHLALDADEQAVEELFADFFARESTSEVIRAAEPLGFHRQLWERLCGTGAPGMALPVEVGGGGASLGEASIAVGQAGRRIAPVPLTEHIVATRLLAALDADAGLLEGLAEGTSLATLALRPAAGTVAALVPAGAVADVVVALVGDDLLVVQGEPPGVAPPNTSASPVADRDLAGGEVLASGERARQAYGLALDEWRALTATALVGLGQQALDMGVEYVLERHQFGVPVGSFQAVQHGLADVCVALTGARFLSQKAVCALRDGWEDSSRWAPMAFRFAAETAQQSAAASLQYHGGYGYAEEYDIQLYYRRAKGWSLIAGDPQQAYQDLADQLFGPRQAPPAGVGSATEAR